MLEHLRVSHLRMAKVNDFIDKLVDEYKVGSQILLLEDSTEVMNASHDRT